MSILEKCEGIHENEMTYVKKKVEARGKPCAKSPGIDVGLFNIPFREAIIPDERVTIKNECFKFFFFKKSGLFFYWM